MAVRVYYGTCDTAANESVKQVIIADADLNDQNFQFNVGDLLSVYFLQENTAESPSLAIYNGDVNHEISTTAGSGKFVKTKRIDIEGDGVQLWQAGDTLTFCYTKANINQSYNYYWETFDYVVASNERYGITMITGEENIPDLESWAETSDENDYSTALAPGVLKQFLNEFYGKPTGSSDGGGSDEPVPVKAAVNLYWWQNPQNNSDLLGKLWVNGDENTPPENAVQITYPLMNTIRNECNRLFDIHGSITNTRQIANWGPNPNLDGEGQGDRNHTGIGAFYITNNLPKYLYYDINGDGNPQLLFSATTDDTPLTDIVNQECVLHSGLRIGTVADMNNNRPHALRVRGSAVIEKNETVKGWLKVGTEWASGATIPTAVNAYGHIVTHGGNINAGSGYIYTTGNVRGEHCLEKGQDGNYHYLSTMYAKRVRFSKYTAKHTIGKNDSTGNQYINCFKTGGNWTLKGIVGFNFNEQTSEGGAPSLCHLWECFPESSDGWWRIRYAIRSYRNYTNKIEVTFWTIEEYTI